MRRVRPDLVHCNGVPTWPVLAAAEVCRTPVLQHVRTAELDGLEDCLAGAERLIAVSRFVETELLRASASQRIRVCYNGIDTAHLRRSAAARREGRRLFGIDPEAFVLLCIARCSPSKRLEVVIRAFHDLARTDRDARLLIVGEIEDAIYYESLRHEIAARRLGSRVRFAGAVENIQALHAASDALMLASVREPLGNAVLEAMAMQTPVIASRSGGIPEILDEACGTLVAPGAVREFAAALRCVARATNGCGRRRTTRAGSPAVDSPSTVMSRTFDGCPSRWRAQQGDQSLGLRVTRYGLRLRPSA